MQTQLDTRIISSFLLMIDHTIQANGQAYQNVATQFFPATSPYAGTYVYSSPSKPLCNDVSISGANILSGVYLGGQYVSVGQSGLSAINHYKGAIYFTGSNPSSVTITGRAAIKEVGVKLTDQTDWKLLFETNYVANSTHPAQPTTGLPLDTEVSPIVFLRVKSQENKPFGFGKLDNQTIGIRAIVIANNEHQKISLTTILKNLRYTSIPLIAATPFDAVGNMTGVNYNYSNLSQDLSYTPIIFGVKAIDVPQQGQYKDIRRNMAIVDFEISTIAK
jgi:hypothetical protein